MSSCNLAWNLWEVRKRKHIMRKEVHKLQRKCQEEIKCVIPVSIALMVRHWSLLEVAEENNFSVKETKIIIPNMFSGSAEVHFQFFDCFLFYFYNTQNKNGKNTSKLNLFDLRSWAFNIKTFKIKKKLITVTASYNELQHPVAIASGDSGFNSQLWQWLQHPIATASCDSGCNNQLQ